MTAGRARARLRVRRAPRDFAGTGRLLVDGELVGEGEIPHFTPVRFSITGAGLTCGYEVGPAVSTTTPRRSASTATLRRVVVDVSGAAYRDLEAEFERDHVGAVTPSTGASRERAHPWIP